MRRNSGEAFVTASNATAELKVELQVCLIKWSHSVHPVYCTVDDAQELKRVALQKCTKHKDRKEQGGKQSQREHSDLRPQGLVWTCRQSEVFRRCNLHRFTFRSLWQNLGPPALQLVWAALRTHESWGWWLTPQPCLDVQYSMCVHLILEVFRVSKPMSGSNEMKLDWKLSAL